MISHKLEIIITSGACINLIKFYFLLTFWFTIFFDLKAIIALPQLLLPSFETHSAYIYEGEIDNERHGEMWVVIIITWNIINVCIWKVWGEIYGTLRWEFIVYLIYLLCGRHPSKSLSLCSAGRHHQKKQRGGEQCRKLSNVTVILILDAIHSTFHVQYCVITFLSSLSLSFSLT